MTISFIKASPVTDKTAETYASVIDKLLSGDYDGMSIVKGVATKYPEIFLEFCGVGAEQWHHTVVNFLKNDLPVNAIKEFRNATISSLKDAKDVCDTVRRYMRGELTTIDQVENEAKRLVSQPDLPRHAKILASIVK